MVPAVSISSSTGFSAFGDRGYSVNVISQAAWLAPFVQAPCFGDLNGDRAVNSADFSVLLSNFGKAGPSAGDLDKDGDCDFVDFNLLSGVFGTSCQ